MLRGPIEVRGVRYRVVDEGVGPPILFAHGFPLDHTMWSAQIAEFSKTHRVIAPDLRGFGGTDWARSMPFRWNSSPTTWWSCWFALQVERPW